MTGIEIGNIIRERRKFLKITQSALSEITGISHHTLTNIESGKGNPTVEILEKILNTLGMELNIRIRNKRL